MSSAGWLADARKKNKTGGGGAEERKSQKRKVLRVLVTIVTMMMMKIVRRKKNKRKRMVLFCLFAVALPALLLHVELFLFGSVVSATCHSRRQVPPRHVYLVFCLLDGIEVLVHRCCCCCCLSSISFAVC